MGTLPQSASAGQDPTDTISPKGSLSQDINFASCNAVSYVPPINSWAKLPPGALTAAQIANLQTSLTGQASANMSGMCAGLNHGDNIARGYVTVDTVNNCTARFPGDSGVFGTRRNRETPPIKPKLPARCFTSINCTPSPAVTTWSISMRAIRIRWSPLPAITRFMGAMTASRPWITASRWPPIRRSLRGWQFYRSARGHPYFAPVGHAARHPSRRGQRQ